MGVREEVSKMDSYDALLIRLGGQPDLFALATRWRELRSASGMGQVRPFSGTDASAESSFFLLEILLRLEKLRSELAVASREAIQSGSPDFSILMAQSCVNRADVLSQRLAEVLVELHACVHGVGLVPTRGG